MTANGFIRWHDCPPMQEWVIQLFHADWAEPVTTTRCAMGRCASTEQLWWRPTAIGRRQMGID